MPDIQVARETYIMVSDDGAVLYPSPNLYPDPDLYPQNATRIANIVEGSMSLDELLCDGELKFGQMCATKFEVTVYDTVDVGGKYLSVYQEDDGIYHQVFSGVVDSAKLDRLGTDRQVVAYDQAYAKSGINVASWWTTFWTNNNTATLKQLRNSLLGYAGIVFEDVTLINDSTILSKTVDLTSISFSEMLRMICELSCCFPHFNRDGELEFVMLETSSIATSLETLYEGENSSFQDYTTQAFTGIQFYGNSSDLQYTEGTSVNPYKVQENILLYGVETSLLHSIGDNMLDYISTITYTPSSVKMIVSDWTYSLGDKVSTTKGNFYILHQAFDGMQLIEQTIEQLGTEVQTETPIETNIADVLDKADKAEMNDAIGDANDAIDAANDAIDVLDDDINNPVTGVKVTIEKTAEQIKSTVAATQKEWDTTGYTITLYGYDTPANEGYSPGSYSGAYYLNQTNGYIYYSNGSTWSYVKACSTIQVALQSSITQNANAIELKVSKGTVTSQLLLETDQITLSSGRLVISSGNFQVNSNGYMTCYGASVRGDLILLSGDKIQMNYVSGSVYDYNSSYTYDVLYPRMEYGVGIMVDAYQNWNFASTPTVGNSTYLATRSWASSNFASSSDISAVDATARSAASDASDAYSRANQAYSLASGCLNSVTNGSSAVGTWTTWNNHNVVNDIYQSGSSVCATRYNVNTSDVRLKEGFADMPDFTNAYMKFKPKEFNFHHDLPYQDHGRHYGLIAQEFKSICDEEGINLNDNLHSIWHTRDVEVEGNEGKYIGDGKVQMFVTEDLHAIHIQMIQKQQREIDDLKAKISNLEEVLNGISKSNENV